jgi:uncharacterized protein YxeA
MKTNIIVGIVVVIAVAVGGYFFFGEDMMKRNANTITTENTGEETSTENTQSGKKMAFSELVKQGGSYKCTVNWNAGGIDTQAIAYMSNGMLRNEANTNVAGFSVDTYIIVKDGYSYTWTSMTPNSGFKSKVTAGVSDTNTGTSGTFTFNAEQVGDYDCEAWSGDVSMFDLPAGVTFKEV